MSLTLTSLLLEHPFAPDQPLVHSATETMTAQEVSEAAQNVAHRLRGEGVEPGHAVAVQFANEPLAIATMFGVWLAGAVFVPVNARAPETERDRQLSVTRPAALLTREDLVMLPDPMDYDDGVAFVTWTSGTTGTPAPVLHTHANYLELLDRVLGPLRGERAADPTRRPTPNLVPVSLALNAGIYNALFGLRAGAEIVIMDGFDPLEFAALVRRFAIRSTVLPPAAMTMLADTPAVTDLAPLKYVRSITAPLSPLQAKRFADRFGIVVLNGYGQAEIGEVIGWTAADARDHPEKLGAIGRPHPGVDVALGDVDPDTGVGRLLVRPPSTAVGIDPARVDADGRIDTGDLARIDGDGFVWIEGRAGDVINRGGNKVFPEHVEEVLRLLPGVREAAVVGAPDDRLGEVPVTFVVIRGAVTDDELRAICRTHLAPYKIPVAFHRVDVFARFDVGKVLRRELVARVGG